ncbi:sensor domain-containing protein [Halorussus gelatinilyticus]|uniref:Sensor domain-containing protein n=1 Tax=Halorussus gelatinilyticus TaxID=2937524 RepID=A0A8U0IIJ5_9EURY|nr:sensor domain-containing protein [Halorussus gelatinilyticus]UPW00920.1 sensor domain-containing protein [Halorussus gelatinilyticus]
MTTTVRDAATSLVGVPVRAQTYRNLVYLALAFPLGLAYFVGLTLGLSLGVGLAVTWFGIPILLATLAGATLVARVEAELSNRLLGTDVRSRPLDTSGGVVAAAKRLVTARRTWLDAGYLLVKFGLGVVSFAALTTLGSLAGSLLAAPLTYSSNFYVGLRLWNVTGGPFESGRLVVDTLGEAVGVGILGVVVAVASLHALNGLARLSGSITEALLDEESSNATDDVADAN